MGHICEGVRVGRLTVGGGGNGFADVESSMLGVCLHEFLLLMSRKCVHERSQLFESIEVSAGRLINGLIDVGLDVLVDW